jgi:hypothetical protein
MRTVRFIWLLIAFRAYCLSANAQLSIEVGHFNLIPNTPGQEIEIQVRNTSLSPISVAGLSLNVQVADSGPAPGLGHIAGPAITKVDILKGSVFEFNNTGQQDAGSSFQFANWTTTTDSETVTFEPQSSTPLAILTLDTTGFTTPASWNFNLGNTINGPTMYFDSEGGESFPSISDGTLSVPEPTTMVLLAAALLTQSLARRYVKNRSGGYAKFR